MLLAREQRMKEFLKWKDNRQRGIDRRLEKLTNGKKSKGGLIVVSNYYITKEKLTSNPIPILTYGNVMVSALAIEEPKMTEPVIDYATLEREIREENVKFSNERKQRINNMAVGNAKNLIAFCETENFNRLNRTRDLDDLCRNILLYNAVYHARQNGDYNNLLQSHKDKIGGNIKYAIEKLYGLEYLEDGDLDHLNQTFLRDVQHVEKREKVKTKGIADPSYVKVNDTVNQPANIEVNGYNLDMLDIVLNDGLRLKRKFIGNNCLPYRHVLINAIRRNPKLDRDSFELTLSNLVKDNVIMTKGQGNNRIYSLNPKYASCSNKELAGYVKKIL